MSSGNLGRLGFAVSIVACIVSPALAEDVPQGKTIALIIGSDAGGGFDTYSRALMRTMPKYLPGQPSIVLQYMPGATGITATNHLYNVAAKDGSVFGAISNSTLYEPLYGNQNAKYEPAKFGWLGSMGKQRPICVTWGASDIKSLEDAKKRIVAVSASSNTSNHATTPRLLNHLLGTKFKVITGYGSTESRLAVERGEAEGMCQSWGTLKTAAPSWLQNKQINVLVQTGSSRQKDLPDVPLLSEKVSDPQDKAVLALLNLPEDAGRPFAMPPGTPAPLVAALRKAFDQTMADEAFLAEADKVAMEVDPVGGADMQRLIAAAFDTPAPLIERATNLLGRQTR